MQLILLKKNKVLNLIPQIVFFFSYIQLDLNPTNTSSEDISSIKFAKGSSADLARAK